MAEDRSWNNGRTLSWLEIVQKSWGKDWSKPDTAYEFTNRTFDDNARGGPYGSVAVVVGSVSWDNGFTWDNGVYWDGDAEIVVPTGDTWDAGATWDGGVNWS